MRTWIGRGLGEMGFSEAIVRGSSEIFAETARSISRQKRRERIGGILSVALSQDFQLRKQRPERSLSKRNDGRRILRPKSRSHGSVLSVAVPVAAFACGCLHSHRRAALGSTRVARCAGIQLAKN